MNATMRKFAISAIASTAIATMAFTPIIANAAATKDQVVEASKTGKADPNLILSQDGFNVMRDVRAARIAIFNGDTDAAKTYVENAGTDLGAVKKDANVLGANSKGDENLVPIDGELLVTDDFIATPEKAKHIATGNEHIKKGNTKEALEHLKLANVDIGFTRVLMPLKETEDHVAAASKLIQDNKFYEANIALKAAEDGLNVETVMLVAAPKTDKAASNNATDQAQPAKTGAAKTSAN